MIQDAWVQLLSLLPALREPLGKSFDLPLTQNLRLLHLCSGAERLLSSAAQLCAFPTTATRWASCPLTWGLRCKSSGVCLWNREGDLTPPLLLAVPLLLQCSPSQHFLFSPIPPEPPRDREEEKGKLSPLPTVKSKHVVASLLLTRCGIKITQSDVS